MLFGHYFEHRDARIRPSLLWEYDLIDFDWQKNRNIVVQRVIERGQMDDYYAMLNMYGLPAVRQAICEIPYLNDKDLNFVCVAFDLKKEDLQCYIRKRSLPRHWNS